MLDLINEEAKTKEEALKILLDKNNLKEDELFIKYEFIEGKLFKSSKYIITAIKKSTIKEFICNYIKDLSVLLNIDIETEILILDDSFNVTLVSDNNAILIGKEGKTLNAIQVLLRQAIKQNSFTNIKVNVDVGNYKLSKMKNIEKEVKKIAKEVIQSQVDVSLDPMNSYERRLVHNIINEYPELETESFGEGKERHVVIRYNNK